MITLKKSQQRGYDWGIIFSMLLLLGLSLNSMWSVSIKAANHYELFIRHGITMVIALTAFIGACLYDYQRLQRLAPALYILMLFLLILVLWFGQGIGGTRRWFILGPFSFQPSELAKLLLILTLSLHFSLSNITRLRHLALLSLHALIPFWLIFKEPDLGTSLVVIGIFLSMLAVSPLSPVILISLMTPAFSLLLYIWNIWIWYGYITILVTYVLIWFFQQKQKKIPFRKDLLKRAGLVAANVFVAWGIQFVWAGLEMYQKNRIITFLSPGQDPLNTGYQVNQAKIAVGAGGWLGQGIFQGSQTQLQLVPEQHTDFIFSAIAEETGFLGSVLVMLLFCILIGRVLMIAFRASQSSGLYLCVGVASLLFIHVFINIGMNLGLLPVTGLPLPLLSYGGTAMVIHLTALGLVENVHLSQGKKGHLTGTEP